jgi:hypothetical protein
MDLFIDAHQYGQINQAQNDAATARSKTDNLERRLATAERRLDRLTLASQALWELLKERTDLTIEQVFAKMEEIDLRDGRKDGKIGGRVLTCAACHRTVNALHTTCLYCGQPIPTDLIAP